MRVLSFSLRLSAMLALAAGILAGCTGSSSSVPTTPAGPSSQTQVAGLTSKIQHIIVIYQENWSFDALYSKYPGANGSSIPQGQLQYGSVDQNGNCAASPSYQQMTTLTVPPLLTATTNRSPWPCGPTWVSGGVSSYVNAGGSNPDPAFAGTFATPGTGLAPQGYSLNQFDSTGTLTGDITHVFWHEQIQIDNGVLEPSNGSMDKFVVYSSNPGYVFSQYDATNLPEGKIAQHYTMLDNYFHSAFGGSFLNHQWLICACTPMWNQAFPAATTFEATWNSTTKTLIDAGSGNGNITLMPLPQSAAGQQAGQYYVVNTTQTANNPHSLTTSADQLLAPIQGVKTIGDELSAANQTWKWYSGDWSLAIANSAQATNCFSPSVAGGQMNSPPGSGDCFQYHHQPFNYYANFGSTAPANCAAPTPHLCDESVGPGNFMSDLSGGTLPAVSFVKPVGVNNEHPNYSELIAGQNHVQSLMAAICASPYWNNTIVIITYDENGGRWDHVTPPAIDQWGPGTRVPAIIASPYAKPGFVDHTQYETTSILALIEARFGLSALGSRDARDNPFLNAFNFNQAPLACQSS